MNKAKVIAIIGARPQFIKHFPFEREAIKHFDLITIHTGQHYDQNMSQVFFDELGMRQPDYLLSLGGGNHGEQTGKMLIEIEQIVLAEKPDMVLVYGDTNSTLAGALIASKLHIKLAHVEAGLRSYNKEMPEEINRVMTDHASDLLLVPSQVAVDNLEKESITEGIHIVGDLMKDLTQLTIENKWVKDRTIDNPYYYITLHRPYNVDQEDRLNQVLDALNTLDKKAVFAIHPRTKNRMKEFGLSEASFPNIQFIDPQPYFNNLTYLYYSDALITDSGGMQKEAYWLQKKCVTVRPETEWVETLDDNWNTLVFDKLEEIQTALDSRGVNWNAELYGDGASAQKMMRLIKEEVLRKK